MLRNGQTEEPLGVDTHEKLDELISQWARRHLHQGRCFIKDGIIDADRWKTTAPKVLALLKEGRHEGLSTSWDLREYIRKDIRENGRLTGPALKNTSYWCYAIHHVARGRLRGFPVGTAALDQAVELFLSSALVNIKKSGGKAQSSFAELAEYARADGDLLRQQIELIDPDIVICGYTWPHVKHLWPEAKNAAFEGVWRVGRRVFLDFWHPGHRIADDLKYYAFACLLQNSDALFKLDLPKSKQPKSQG